MKNAPHRVEPTTETNMYAPWQRTFRTFAGPGIDFPSDSMRITDDEAAAVLERLTQSTWSPELPSGAGCGTGFTLRHARRECVTALFARNDVAGFYAGSYLWIARAYRGHGLSVPLILAAAMRRRGTVLPPGVVVQGFTNAGLAAHRAAHRRAVHAALQAGQAVPSAVREEVCSSRR